MTAKVTSLRTDEAQAQLRHSYINGGPGALVSGLVWLVASLVIFFQDTTAGFITLFVGGLLIFPISTVLERKVFKRRPTDPANPGVRISLETLPGMLALLIVGLLLLQSHPGLAFPLAAIGVGARYIPFRTAYGLSIFWLLGGAILGLGLFALSTRLISDFELSLGVSLIEIFASLWLIFKTQKA